MKGSSETKNGAIRCQRIIRTVRICKTLGVARPFQASSGPADDLEDRGESGNPFDKARRRCIMVRSCLMVRWSFHEALEQDVAPDDLEQDSRHGESWTELSKCARYHSDLLVTWKDLDFPHLCPDNGGQLLENGGLAKSHMSILVSICSSHAKMCPTS